MSCQHTDGEDNMNTPLLCWECLQRNLSFHFTSSIRIKNYIGILSPEKDNVLAMVLCVVLD